MDYLKISEEKVKSAMGKTWKQWADILDDSNAKKAGHTATAKYLRETYELSGWWSQVVTARYEKEKGYWVRHGK